MAITYRVLGTSVNNGGFYFMVIEKLSSISNRIRVYLIITRLEAV